MRLLFDENLSRKLVGCLADAFPGSAHVTSLGLGAARDADVWRHARAEGLVLVTKDNDFLAMALRHGPPPLVVWLRSGNGPTERVAKQLRDHANLLERAVVDPTVRIVELG